MTGDRTVAAVLGVRESGKAFPKVRVLFPQHGYLLRMHLDKTGQVGKPDEQFGYGEVLVHLRARSDIIVSDPNLGALFFTIFRD